MDYPPAIRRYRITDQVYDILKDQILRGVLAPGRQVSVDELAKTLKISPTPVREALNRLKAQRLIVDSNNGRMSVTMLSSEEVVQLSQLYAALQVLALEWGFHRISRDELGENLKVLQENKANVEAGAVEHFLKADVTLHDLIVDAAGNQWLTWVVSQIRDFIALIRNMFPSVERYREAWEDHVAIVESLLRGDKAAAINAVERHTEHVRDRLLACLERDQGSRRPGA